MANCSDAPPWRKSTAKSSESPSSERRSASARPMMPSKAAERWLISRTDIPAPW